MNRTRGRLRGVWPLLLVALLLWACGDASPTPSSSLDTPSHEPMALSDTARDVQWELSIASPRAGWSAAEAIVVKAELSYLGPGDGTRYSASGSGPLAFGVAEEGGTRHLEGGYTLDCRAYEIRMKEPLVVAYAKSGGFIGEDPNADFYRRFLEDPLLHLPAGTWTLSVGAVLYMPPGCGDGREVRLGASITITVE